MSALTQKLEIIKWLAGLEDDQMVNRIYELKRDEEFDWAKSLSQEELDAIDEGMEDTRKGKQVSHLEILNKYEKWL